MALLDGLVLTHDSIAEGVHFLPFDPPADVGWKLVAVNLSDLAAKGATPAGALLSLTLGDDPGWEEGFLGGLEEACRSFGLPLLGGDTIALPPGAPRVLGLTAIGRAGPATPSRSGGRADDALWLVGTVGDSAAGLARLREDPRARGPLVQAYRRPLPLLAAGRALAPHAHATMDVSDGLLIDLSRLASASGCSATVGLEALPLSPAFIEARGDTADSRLFAATGGDDYVLLAAFSADPDPLLSISLPPGTRVTRIGSLGPAGAGLRLTHHGQAIPLPERLGHEHCPLSAAPVAGRT